MRKIFSKIHLWLSVPLGIIISVICFTGACLAFEQDITRALNSHLYEVQYTKGMNRLNPSEIVERVMKHTGDTLELSSLRISSDPEASCQISFKNSGKKVLCVNPYNGEILGWSKSYPFFMQMKKLHRWLLDPPGSKTGGSVGRYIVGITTIAMTLILISGLFIWIPKTRKGLKNRLSVACNKGKRRFWYDSHVALGFYATIFLLLMSLTGPTWSFGWYKDMAYNLLGANSGHNSRNTIDTVNENGKGNGKSKENEKGKEKEKSMGRDDISMQDSEGDKDYIVFDKVYNNVLSSYKDFNYMKINNNTVSVTLSPDGYRQKSDNITFNPQNGEFVKIAKYEDTPLKQKLRGIFYSLHVGNWGGIWSKILYFIAALIGTSLPITGYYLWLKKKMR